MYAFGIRNERFGALLHASRLQRGGLSGRTIRMASMVYAVARSARHLTVSIQQMNDNAMAIG
jgi:hypothetical protein